MGAANDEAAAIYTLDHLIRRYGHAARSDLILKMDIEGAELDIFPAVSRETLRHFRQIVFEVHGLLGLGDPAFRARFVAALSSINSDFTLFHVHANNYGNIGFVDGFAVADVIELSYVSPISSRKRSRPAFIRHQSTSRTVRSIPTICFGSTRSCRWQARRTKARS